MPSSRALPGVADPDGVVVENLTVRYGDAVAVDGVSLSVRRGELAVAVRHPLTKVFYVPCFLALF